MEKEAERDRKSIKLQSVVLAAAALVTAFIALGPLQMVTPALAGQRWASVWDGSIGGASFAGVGMMVLGIVRNARALKSKKNLKKQYSREHDERWMKIRQHSGHAAYWFDAIGLWPGTVIGGYFNPAVAFNCLGRLLYICLVRVALKVYYSKKRSRRKPA